MGLGFRVSGLSLEVGVQVCCGILMPNSPPLLSHLANPNEVQTFGFRVLGFRAVSGLGFRVPQVVLSLREKPSTTQP